MTAEILAFPETSSPAGCYTSCPRLMTSTVDVLSLPLSETVVAVETYCLGGQDEDIRTHTEWVFLVAWSK